MTEVRDKENGSRGNVPLELRMSSDGQVITNIVKMSEEPVLEADKSPQFLAALIVTLAHFTSGYAMGWTSPVLPLLAASPETKLTDTQAGWVGSLFCIGAALATPAAGIMADRLGRKQSVILTAVPFIVSWVLKSTLTTTSITALYIARLFAGASAGALVVVAPMYIAEIAEPSIRGALANLLLVMFNVGLLAAYAAGAVLDSILTLSLLGFVPVAIFLAGACTWLPESPLLLVSKGRITEARNALRRLRGPKCDVESELRRLEAGAAADREVAENSSFIHQVRTSHGLRRALGTVLGLMTCQQLCGISAILAYTANIFKEAGSEIDPNSCAVIVGALQVIFTLLCSGLLDRAGRKPLIIGSSFLMVIALCGLGGFFEVRDAGVDVTSFNWLPLLALSLYIVLYSGGLGPVPWVLIGEVFPTSVRGPSTAVVGMWAWGQAFFVTLAFPPLLASIGINGAVWIFAAGCAVAGIFSIAYCPETKGKSLEQILEELEGKKSTDDKTVS